MSGGGGSVSRGRMGTAAVQQDKVDPNQIQTWEKTLEKETKESQNCREERARLMETISRTQKELKDIQHATQKCSMDIKNLTEQENSLQGQKSEQVVSVKNAAPDQKELKALETQVNQFTKEYRTAQEKASAIEDEVHNLHKQIMDIGGSKLKSAESKVNHVSTQIDQIVGLQTKANVNIKTAKRNMKKCEDKTQSMEDEFKENQETLVKLDAELKQLEEDATKVLEAYNSAQEEMTKVEKELEGIKQKIDVVEEKEQNINKDNIEIKHQLEKIEGIVKEHQSKLKHWTKELGKLQIHKIDGEETHEELKTHDEEYLDDIDENAINYQITILEEKLRNMKPNMSAIAEYKRKEELYLKRVSELDKITELRDSQRVLHTDLRKQRLDEFAAGFSIITNKLKEMYQMITLGGDAELELVDSLDPFSEGIVFSVRPPKKSWKNISNLSGGEKTLSSLALVFALHHYKPTPLYVMDEIDAALDFKNVSIVANYIKERTRNAQFIIISLRNNMFELADLLIGIYKTYDCTDTVAINPRKMCLPLQEVDTNSHAPAQPNSQVSDTAGLVHTQAVTT